MNMTQWHHDLQKTHELVGNRFPSWSCPRERGEMCLFLLLLSVRPLSGRDKELMISKLETGPFHAHKIRGENTLCRGQWTHFGLIPEKRCLVPSILVFFTNTLNYISSWASNNLTKRKVPDYWKYKKQCKRSGNVMTSHNSVTWHENKAG